MSETTAPVDDETPEEDPFSQMDPAMARAPQPVFAEMRAAMRVLPMEGSVVLAGRAEVDEALRQADVFSSNMSAVDLQNVRPMIPLQIDPPDHKKYRRILDPLFAPRKVAAELEEPVTELVNELIDELDDRTEIDFAADFSTRFPTQVFLTLLGLPLENLPTFLAMKDGIIRPNHVVGTAFGTPEAVAHQKATADSIYAYFDEVLDEREREPRDDLLSEFLATEVDGVRLTRHEILDICFLFLIAGLDTVTATLDCMFAFLAEHPDHRRQIVEDPELIPSAVEEMLRWETPVMGIVRAAVADTEIAGCPVKKGDHVIALIGSANTDEEFLEDADEVRFDREVNRHIAFGGGIHRCLGSHLARLELRIALREWHRRIPDYSVPEGHELVYTAGIRSIEHFPMVLARPATA
ncbi:MAG: cytochrome P450 [Acidimicrobiales bacterium]|nr:cytochrome P450 [Acidimicrobiales bacterium]